MTNNESGKNLFHHKQRLNFPNMYIEINFLKDHQPFKKWTKNINSSQKSKCKKALKI